MNLKNKLTQLKDVWNTLQTKIKTKLQVQQKTITETNQKLNETNHKLELTAKENSENEKVLEQLLKEFKELGEQLG